MELDTDKIDEPVLVLLVPGQHEGYKAWKAFDVAAAIGPRSSLTNK
jgi:hypothetical protein